MNKHDFIDFLNITTEQEIISYSNRYNNNEFFFKSIKHEISFLYNLGLFFSELYENDILLNIFRKDEKYYYSIYYYLRAIKLYEINKENFNMDKIFINEVIRRCYVNLGNEYSNQFRTIDALRFYRQALKIDSFFAMAIGNYAHCIERHPVFFDFKEADKIFNLLLDIYNSIDIMNLDAGQEFFLQKKYRYNHLLNTYLAAIKAGENAHYRPNCHLSCIDKEDTYENWCLENTLYINPLNDIDNYIEAKEDIKFSSIISIVPLDQKSSELLKHMYELFQYARKKIYYHRDFLKPNSIHEICSVFTTLYSYFDKTAFWLSAFFNLKCKDESKININSVWDFETNQKVRLLDLKNQYLYNIYWLRKEYRPKGWDLLDINCLLSPDSQDYSNIRNVIEHRGFSYVAGETNYINPEELFLKTLKLGGVVRNLILSMIFAADIENRLTQNGQRNLDLVYFQYEGF